MTRITADGILQDEAPERFERRPRRRKRRRGLGCCSLLSIVLLLSIFIGCAVVAKSGILEIPIFSDLFYRVPKPTHFVTVDVDANQELAVVTDLVSGTATFSITEAQLTQILRRSLSDYDSVAISTAQAAILPEGIELFGLVVKPVRVTVTALVTPVVENQQLTVAVKKVMLGNVSLPLPWTEGIMRWLLGGMIDRVAQAVATLTVERIELDAGVLHAIVPLSSSLLQVNLPSNSNVANFE